MQMMSSQSNPIAKVHAMDLFDIRYQLHQLTWYVKNQVPALCPLSGLSPGPGEVIDLHLGLSLPGNTVSKVCFLLEHLSWLVDKRVSVQRDAGSHKTDYLAVYRSHFANKMDTSVFDNPTPRKFPLAPRKSQNSSYRTSLRSFRFVSHIKAAEGRFSRRHRPFRQARAGNASRTRTFVSYNSEKQSPEI